MDTFTYGNALPWPIEPAYLLQLLELSTITVVVMFVAGLAYASLYHLLLNRTHPGSPANGNTTSSRNIMGFEARLKRSQASNEVLKRGLLQ